MGSYISRTVGAVQAQKSVWVPWLVSGRASVSGT